MAAVRPDPISAEGKATIATGVTQALPRTESSASNATEHRYYSSEVEIVDIATTIATQ